jgi:hypothetical protein
LARIFSISNLQLPAFAYGGDLPLATISLHGQAAYLIDRSQLGHSLLDFLPQRFSAFPVLCVLSRKRMRGFPHKPGHEFSFDYCFGLAKGFCRVQSNE